MPVIIKKCNGGMVAFGARGEEATVYMRKLMPCISPYQDEKYGEKMRVHNVTKSGDTRCTVCGFGRGIVRP